MQNNVKAVNVEKIKQEEDFKETTVPQTHFHANVVMSTFHPGQGLQLRNTEHQSYVPVTTMKRVLLKDRTSTERPSVITRVSKVDQYHTSDSHDDKVISNHCSFMKQPGIWK